MAQGRATDSRRGAAVSDLGTWHEMLLAFRLYRDPRVSVVLKSVVPMLAALYVMSPIDLIPDFLLGVGQVDDLGALAVALFVGLKLIRRCAPSAIVAEHLAAMGLAASGGSDDASGQSGDVIDASYRVVKRANRRATADGGRRVA